MHRVGRIGWLKKNTCEGSQKACARIKKKYAMGACSILTKEGRKGKAHHPREGTERKAQHGFSLTFGGNIAFCS